MVAIETYDVLAICHVKGFVIPSKLVPVGRDDTDKWVADKEELCVVLQFCLQGAKKTTENHINPFHAGTVLMALTICGTDLDLIFGETV